MESPVTQNNLIGTVSEHIADSSKHLPSQTGNSGKVLTTDGTDASWASKIDSLPYGTSSTGASTVQKVVSIPEITELKVGQVIVVKPTVTSTVASSTIKLNDFDAYKMLYNGAEITTSTDSIVWSANIPSMFILDENADGTVRYWRFLGHGLDSNTTYTINYSYDSGAYVAGVGTYAITRYSICAMKPDMTWEKITATNANYSTGTTKSVNTNGFVLNQLRYYNTTTTLANGSKSGTNTMSQKAASVTMSYSLNCGTAPSWTTGLYIYLVGTMGADGLFYFDTTQWWATELPSTNDGKLYIRIGKALTTTDSTMAFYDDRPIFYHDGTKICEYKQADNKQDKLSQTQLDSVNSGVTSTKVGNYDSHLGNTSNPHSVTKAQVGLGNVDNTSDLNKPISTATQTALDDKQDKITPTVISTSQTVTPTEEMSIVIDTDDVILTLGNGLYDGFVLTVLAQADCSIVYAGVSGNQILNCVDGNYNKFIWNDSYWVAKNNVPILGIDDNNQQFAFNIDSLVESAGTVNISGTDADGNSFNYGLDNLITGVTTDGVQRLTNKTIAYADNTLTGVQPTLTAGTGINISGTTISTKQTFSTSEVATGDVWIDGKPIYRSSFVTTSFTKTTGNNRTYFTSNGGIINNVDNMIKMEGVFKVDFNGTVRSLPVGTSNLLDTTSYGAEFNSLLVYRHDTGGFWGTWYAKGSFTSQVYKLIANFYYTKTTDWL